MRALPRAARTRRPARTGLFFVLLFGALGLAGPGAARAAAPVTLPASPFGAAAGDVDGDGTGDLALLLVYPAWGSGTEFTDTAEGTSVDVVSAITDRRELLVFRLTPEGPRPLAAPLRVGREVLAIDGRSARGPVVVLTDDGPKKLVLGAAPAATGVAGSPAPAADASGPAGDAAPPPADAVADGSAQGPVLELAPIARLRPLFAGAETVATSLRLLQDIDRDGTAEVLVPTLGALSVVSLAGGTPGDVPVTFRRARSGASGSFSQSVPRLSDFDRDGNVDALEVDRGRQRASLRRGTARGTFGAAVTWDFATLLKKELETVTKDEMSSNAEFVDVLDTDGDGTLEVVVIRYDPIKETLFGALRAARGLPGTLSFYPLRSDGSLGPARESVKTTGIMTSGLLPRSSSAFVDLDGDGKPEIVTLTIDVGVLGIARALASGVGKFDVGLRVYHRGPSGYAEVKDAMPEFQFKIGLSSEELTRTAEMPGDVDGDRIDDLVVVDDRTVNLHRGAKGGRVATKPTATLTLQKPLRSFFGTRWLDLDGDGALDLVAFEALDPQKDTPSRPVQMEILVPKTVLR